MGLRSGRAMVRASFTRSRCTLVAGALWVAALPALSQVPPTLNRPTVFADAPGPVECSHLAALRDGPLYDMWRDGAIAANRARATLPGRQELRRLRNEMARTLSVVPTLEAMAYLAHATRTSTDLIFDLLAVGGKEYVPLPVLTVAKSYQEVRRRLDQDSKNKVADAIRKVQPQVGAALHALANFTRNTQQMMAMAQGGSLASELSSRLADLDRMLAAADLEARQALSRDLELRQIKEAIDRSCGTRPGASTPAGYALPYVPPAGGVPSPRPEVSAPPPATTPPSINFPRLSQIGVGQKEVEGAAKELGVPLDVAARYYEALVDGTASLKGSSRARIARYIDPLTPPQTKLEMKRIEREIEDPTQLRCDTYRQCYPIIGCVDLPSTNCRAPRKIVSVEVPDTLRKKWMECEITIAVEGKFLADKLQLAVNRALNDATVSTLATQIPAALATKGTSLQAAVSQWVATFKVALTARMRELGPELVVGGALASRLPLERRALAFLVSPALAQAMDIMSLQPAQACGWTEWQ